MSANLRICHAKNLDHFFELENAPNNKFKGFTGPLMNPFIDFIAGIANHSVSMERNVGHGKPINGSDRFDGCLGKLQRNETDILLALSDYPSPAGDVLQGMIIFDETMGFLSAYYMGNHVNSDVFRALYHAFDVKIWSLLLLSLALIISISFLHQRILITWVKIAYGSPRSIPKVYHVYSVLTHFTRTGQVGDRSLLKKQLFTVLSIMSLIILHIFSTLIKTDLVVYPDPDIFFTYDDLINRKVRPSFLNGTEDYSYFKYALNGSIQKKVWDYSVKNFEKKMFIEMSPRAFVTIGLDVLNRQAVFISDEIIVSAAIEAGCAILGHKFENAKNFLTFFSKKVGIPYDYTGVFYLYYSVDPRTKKTIKALMVNKYFKGPVANRLKKTYNAVNEHGLSNYITKFVRSSNVMSNSDVVKDGLLGPHVPERGILFRNCKSVRPVKPEVELTQIKLFYFDGLIKLYVTLVLILNLLIIVENLGKRNCMQIKKIFRREWTAILKLAFQNSFRTTLLFIWHNSHN